jgi:Kef-type K+ transport system membrane component KefB
MISRGEMESIVAGVGVTSGALSADIYTTLIIMVAVTTIVTPIGLRNNTRRKQHNVAILLIVAIISCKITLILKQIYQKTTITD